MPAGVKPPHCVGKKGRSGRKTIKEEVREAAIQLAYRDVFDEILPDALLAKKHRELLTVPIKTTSTRQGEVIEVTEELDTNAVKSGLDMAYKIKGHYAPEEHRHQLETKVPEEIREEFEKFKQLLRDKI